MDIGRLATGFVLLTFGLFNAIKPEVYIKYQKWIFKIFYGATFNPSAKTVRINKYFGILFAILGLLVLTF